MSSIAVFVCSKMKGSSDWATSTPLHLLVNKNQINLHVDSTPRNQQCIEPPAFSKIDTPFI
ncbi:hypothetical protein AMELA_G00110430 [Ameiurus melas]|uniref:Uncharacterized protein n=1 Tax=Ameiurus melas TaxID=219545 RepID=A0A7J6ARR5_AMEME|nr:hypothetical protein AMELA_G00110430 [Ameiurus melas]